MNFESVYKEIYPKVFRIANKIVSDEDVANDIVQDVFACCYEKLQKGHPILHPQSYLVRVALNKCADYLKQREKHAPLSAANEHADKEENFEIQQMEVVLRQAIATLKPKEMKLVMLYSEGYSYKDIAQITEINFSSVGKTLSRTLHKLKLILKNLNYEMY
jgi:RNA polymerase sigma-70 factor (ECF subfamily)